MKKLSELYGSYEEAPSLSGRDNQIIQDYVNEIAIENPRGVTLDDVVTRFDNKGAAFHIRVLVALAGRKLLRLSGSNMKLTPDGAVELYNDTPRIAAKAAGEFNLNEGDEDIIDEYDVDENDLHEVKDFIKFMKEYQSFLTEAECDCVMEAEYRGRKVQLGKPMQGDIKKFKVYVKNNKGKVVKVNFGAHGMNIKRNNPKRRNAYRKRHHCDKPGPRWKANYWSCRKW